MIDSPHWAHMMALSVCNRTGEGASVVTDMVGIAVTTIPGAGLVGSSSGKLISGTSMLKTGTGEKLVGDLSSSSAISDGFRLAWIPRSRLRELLTLTGGLGRGRRVELKSVRSRERTDAKVSDLSSVASTGDCRLSTISVGDEIEELTEGDVGRTRGEGRGRAGF